MINMSVVFLPVNNVNTHAFCTADGRAVKPQSENVWCVYNLHVEFRIHCLEFIPLYFISFLQACTLI